MLRTVSACDFWRREIPAWHGWWGKGEFEYCFLINSQDRDPATFTEEEYKQLEDRQNTSPVEITTKGQRSWWWFFGTFYTAPFHWYDTDVLEALNARWERKHAKRAQPETEYADVEANIEFCCIFCEAAGHIEAPDRPKRVTCGACRREMRVWIDEAGRVRTRVVTNNEDKRTYLHPWEVFDLPEYAPIEAVKRAYREAMKQYHPDRVFDLGPELRKLAEEKTKQYNEAYAEIIDYFAA